MRAARKLARSRVRALVYLLVISLLLSRTFPVQALSASSACACPTSGANTVCTLATLVPADTSSTCAPSTLDASGFLDENIIIDGNTFVRSVDFTGLKRLGGAFVVRASRFATSIAAADLTETTTGDVRIEGANGADDFLQSIDLKKLRTVGGSFAIVGQTHTSFTSLDVSALETVEGYLNISDNTNLASLNIKKLQSVSGGVLKILGNKNTLTVRAPCGVESVGLVNGVVTDSSSRALSTFLSASTSYCSRCTFENPNYGMSGYDQNGNWYTYYGATLGTSTLKAYNSSYSCDSTLDANGFLNENFTLVMQSDQDRTYDLSALRHIAGNLEVRIRCAHDFSSSTRREARTDRIFSRSSTRRLRLNKI